MTAVDVVRTVPRLILATPFRLFAVYVSLFCAAVAAVFIYVNIAMLGFLSHEAETSVQGDYDFLLARYREGGLPTLVNAISEHAASSNNALYLLTDGKGRWLAGNLDTVASDLWETQGAAAILLPESWERANRAPGLRHRGPASRRSASPRRS